MFVPFWMTPAKAALAFWFTVSVVMPAPLLLSLMVPPVPDSVPTPIENTLRSKVAPVLTVKGPLLAPSAPALPACSVPAATIVPPP